MNIKNSAIKNVGLYTPNPFFRVEKTNNKIKIGAEISIIFLTFLFSIKK